MRCFSRNITCKYVVWFSQRDTVFVVVFALESFKRTVGCSLCATSSEATENTDRNLLKLTVEQVLSRLKIYESVRRREGVSIWLLFLYIYFLPCVHTSYYSFITRCVWLIG